MNPHRLSGRWTELKNALQAKWSKLTDHDLELTKGSVAGLAGLLEQRYGDAREASFEKLQAVIAKFGPGPQIR